MEIETDLSRSKFCFAVPAYDGKICLETSRSLIETTNKLSKMGVPWCMISLKGSALVDAARNELMHKFLHETDADIMIFIDSDVSWNWEGMERLLVWSQIYDTVCGIYCGRIDPPTFTVNVPVKALNQHGLLLIEGAGMGFIAIQRKCLETLDVPTYMTKNYDIPIKQFCAIGVVDGQYMGEDIQFFRQLKLHGIPAWADPGIELEHTGNKTYSYQFKDIVTNFLGE